MAGRDSTGPIGMGPLTGRGLGPCNRSGRATGTERGRATGLESVRGFGRGRSKGRGGERGRGRGGLRWGRIEPAASFREAEPGELNPFVEIDQIRQQLAALQARVDGEQGTGQADE